MSERGNRRHEVGVVVSDKGQKTVTVLERASPETLKDFRKRA